MTLIYSLITMLLSALGGYAVATIVISAFKKGCIYGRMLHFAIMSVSIVSPLVVSIEALR